MGAASGEVGTFPNVHVEVGDILNGTLPVTLSLPDFKDALVNESKGALKKETPVPGYGTMILAQAIEGCGGCHLHGDKMNPVGRGVKAKCSGFLPLEGDIYTVMKSVADGQATAMMCIEGPHDNEGSNFTAVLCAPCDVIPTRIFERNVVPSE